MTRKKTEAGPVELEYVRLADHVDGGALPLPEGWLADTHIEPDPVVVAQKLATGRYRKVEQLAAATGDTPPTMEG